MVSPLAFPQEEPSAMIDPRQSTTEPKVSKTSAFTPPFLDCCARTYRAPIITARPVEAVRKSCLRFTFIRSLDHDRLPALYKALRGPPRQRLHRERGIARAAGSHHRSSQDAQIRGLVREPPAINHVGFRVVAHTGSAVGVRRNAGSVLW